MMIDVVGRSRILHFLLVVAQSYCSDYPCKNGGTCNNIGTTYNCSCAGGYTNYSCEI